MQTREKKLAIGLAIVVGVMGFWKIIKPWYMDPIEHAQSQLAIVEGELDNLETQQMQLLAATRQLANWRSQSLPPDPKPQGRQRPDALNGQRLYQEWLTDLANHCGITNAKVTPGITRSVQDVYVTVQVRLNMQATYGQLCQFVALFEQTDLLHRVETCQVESANHRGNPVLDVTLVAEGVALQDAPQRDELFPKTELVSAVKPTDTKLTVKSSDGFPENQQFFARVGEESIMVTSVKDNIWQISRAKNQTKAVAHGNGAAIDLGLQNALTAEGSAREMHPKLAMIAEENPFAIPPPTQDYRPYLDVPREQFVYLGDSLQLDVRAEGLNPALGPPKFQFVGEVPPSMKMEPLRDRPNGALITWQPTEESQVDSYTVSIQATREDFEQPLTQSVRIVVQKRNAPPQIAGVDSQLVYSGQALSFTVSATDPNENQRLTFSLGSNAPPEATIDPVTGKFSWTPPGAVSEQAVSVEIVVTDDGNPAERDSLQVPIQVKPDVANFTRFVGWLTAADDKTEASEAWLFDRWNKQELFIREGEHLNVANISARLVKGEFNRLTFERDGGIWVLDLGHDLREMRPIESNDTAQND